jgi:predicted phage baseplate assembly protein
LSAPLQWGSLVVEGDARRHRIRERHGNGIAAVEVREHGTRLLVFFLEHAPRGLHPGNVRIDAPPQGRGVRAVELRRAVEEDAELEDRLVVELDRAGSGGTYRLSIVEREPDGSPGRRAHRGIDPRYAEASFAFDVDAPQPPVVGSPGGAPAADSDISYLLRDYQGLRQLMLDRLAVTIPGEAERHVPDPWVTLVELLAYLGDDLSYYQDAVATEAYLQTARRRVSVRRHARLVDYRLHDGCSARAWVCLEVTRPVAVPLDQIRFAAAGGLLRARPPLIDATAFPADRLAALQQYSPLPARPPGARAGAELSLAPAHNAIELWAWGERDSHLVAGATSAVLVDGERPRSDDELPRRALRLGAGDVVVFEETRDPIDPRDELADPGHRQAVRLTDVHPTVDELYGQALLEVRWAPEDALGFDLAVTARGRACCKANGNVVLVAHGIDTTEDVELEAPRLSRAPLSFSGAFPDLGTVARHQARRLRAMYASWRREIEDWRHDALRGTPLSQERLALLRRQLGEHELEQLGLSGDRDEDAVAGARAERDAEGLAELLAHAGRLLAGRRRRLEALADLADASGPLDEVLIEEVEEDWGPRLGGALAPGRPGSWGPASDALQQDPRAALPVLWLTDAEGGHVWRPALDLIGGAPADRAVVAEVDDDGVAGLRIAGAPRARTLHATYRVGNGTAGNAEAGAINAVVWAGSQARAGGRPPGSLNAITAVRNPLPASEGVDPEDAETAKLRIPGAFLDHQPRALTPEDYVALATDVRGVRRAAAQLRSTGSLAVIDVAVQPAAGEDPRRELLEDVHRALESVRRIGHVVRVHPPRYRPLVIELEVALATTAVRADVAAALARLLSSGWLADGTPALFSPARLGFATTVYSSPIIAATHGVAGVRSAVLKRFGFLGEPKPPAGAAIAAALTVAALEIVRLDNDPALPGNGYALVTLEGGR